MWWCRFQYIPRGKFHANTLKAKEAKVFICFSFSLSSLREKKSLLLFLLYKSYHRTGAFIGKQARFISFTAHIRY
jgi:hypothetical protein